MIKCSVQLGDQMFVKGYGFLSFAKNMSGSIGKNISRNLAGNIVKKLVDHAKQSATNVQLVIWLVIKLLKQHLSHSTIKLQVLYHEVTH